MASNTGPNGAGASANSSGLTLEVYTRNDAIWADFSDVVEGNNTENENEFIPDSTEPGPLAHRLGELCARDGTFDLDAERIMYFSELVEYLITLSRGAELIGFLLLELYPGAGQPTIWLVCVSSAEKGNGYSKILLDKAKQLAREAGKSTIHLEAHTRTVGEKVYKAQGFTFNTKNGRTMTASLSKASNTRKRRNSRRRRNQ